MWANGPCVLFDYLFIAVAASIYLTSVQRASAVVCVEPELEAEFRIQQQISGGRLKYGWCGSSIQVIAILLP